MEDQLGKPLRKIREAGVCHGGVYLGPEVFQNFIRVLEWKQGVIEKFSLFFNLVSVSESSLSDVRNTGKKEKRGA